MKFKSCFTLTVILIILFSLTTVVAGENMIDEAYLANDISNGSISVDKDVDNFNGKTINEDYSNAEEVDLSVRLDFENVKVDNNYNPEGSTFPWTITVKVTGGTAKNVKVHESFSNNIEYFSHNATVGKYDSTTGIWDIGELSSSDTAYLTIFTKVLSTEGRLNNTVDATTTSNDIDLLNNHAYLYAKSTGGKVTSNTTETSADKEGANHNQHSISQGGGFGDRNIETQTGNDNSNQQNGETKSKDSSSDSGEGSNTNTNNEISRNFKGSITKSTQSYNSAISRTIGSLTKMLNSNSDNKDSNSKSELSTDVVKAISVQNYTKIPILIFVVFLIAALGIVVYGKIKP